MKASKKNKKGVIKKGNSLFYIQKKDSKGRKYTFERKTGKRVSNLYYYTQFTSKGRNTKEATEDTVKVIKQGLNRGENITVDFVKRIAEKNYIISSKERDKKRKLEEITFSTLVQQWSMRDKVLSSKAEKFRVKLPYPYSEKFQYISKERLLELIEIYVESINLEIKKFNEEHEGENIYIDVSEIFINDIEGYNFLNVDLSNINLLKINNATEDQIFEIKENIYDRFNLSN